VFTFSANLRPCDLRAPTARAKKFGELRQRNPVFRTEGDLFVEKRPVATRKQRRAIVLTKREREVLFWLARGKSNSEIAAILGIAPATVGKHLEHIYPKLGVENRTAAASFADSRSPR
jgi:DNA-binding CsgD family transcriptional regulator